MCPQDTDAPLNVLCLKGPELRQNYWIVTQIVLDLGFDIIYQHAKYEWNRCSFSKVIERTPIFVQCFFKRPKLCQKLVDCNLNLT